MATADLTNHLEAEKSKRLRDAVSGPVKAGGIQHTPDAHELSFEAHFERSGDTAAVRSAKILAHDADADIE